MFWLIIVSLIVLIAVAVMIYTLPADAPGRSRKKKQRLEAAMEAAKPVSPEKDWKTIAERWEKNNAALLGDIEKIKVRERDVLKNLEESRAQHREALDKLTLEKGWREKEQGNLEKARQHEKALKDQILRTEKDLEQQHSERLRLEREFQDLKIKHESLMEEKRAASTKALSLESTVTQLNGELKDLRRENNELKKKREDIQWVAKTEFDELQKKYNAILKAH